MTPGQALAVWLASAGHRDLIRRRLSADRPAASLAVLTTRSIPAAGTVTRTLRPARRTHTLRLKLKRNGRAVAARSVVRRRG